MARRKLLLLLLCQMWSIQQQQSIESGLGAGSRVRDVVQYTAARVDYTAARVDYTDSSGSSRSCLLGGDARVAESFMRTHAGTRARARDRARMRSRAARANDSIGTRPRSHSYVLARSRAPPVYVLFLPHTACRQQRRLLWTMETDGCFVRVCSNERM